MPEGTGDLGAGGPGRTGTGDNHIVSCRQGVALSAEMIAQDALDAIADHGALVDLARDGKTQAGRVVGRQVMQGEQAIRRRTTTAIEHGVEFRTRT